MLKGIEQAAERILQLSARVGLPQGIIGSSDIVGHPSFATAIGLLSFPYRGEGHWNAATKRRARTGSLGRRLRDWVEETF